MNHLIMNLNSQIVSNSLKKSQIFLTCVALHLFQHIHP